MSKKANPTVVGMFVIGATTLAIAAILVFGSGRFFEKTSKWVLYFDGSIKGLNVGSPVLLSGVQIGSVTDIKVVIDKERHTLTPVVIEIERSRLSVTGKTLSEAQRIAGVRKLVKKGLRAQLQLQSLVTGQLMIQLDFYPDSPIKLVKPDGPIPELPTIPSTMEQVSRTLESLPLEDIVDQIKNIADGIDSLLNSTDLKEMLSSLSSSFENLQQVMERIEKEIGPLAKDTHTVLSKTSTLLDTFQEQTEQVGSDLQGTIQDTRKLVNNSQAHIDRLAKELEDTTTMSKKEIEQTAQQVQDFMNRMEQPLTEFIGSATASSRQAEKMLSENSEFRYQITEALTEILSASRAVRLLMEYLEEHPEALLKGKRSK